jgi:hypothetical protein
MAAHGRFTVFARTRLARCAVVVLILFLGSLARADELPRRVLMLHSYNYTFPATTVTADAARKRLLERSPQKVEIYGDFLDLLRAPDAGNELRTANFLREKYTHMSPDVVMALGSSALPFIVKYRNIIAPKVPVVFTGVTPESYADLQPPSDITGILIDLNFDKGTSKNSPCGTL